MPVRETWFCSNLGVPIPDLVENPRSCACQYFDIYEDHLQTCQGDIEIGKYIVLRRGQDDLLPPRPIQLDYTMTHDRFGHSNLHTNGKLTHYL